MKTSREGLSDFEARGRLDAIGKNQLPSSEKFSSFQIFLRQFKNPLFFIVMAAAISSFFIGHLTDAFFIIFVVLINTTVGFFQENKAEKALEKLKKAVEFYCRVYRQGTKREILSECLVPGDIVEIQEGDKIPADGRLIWSEELEVNESMLTGESISVEKNCSSTEENKEITDQADMVFWGSIAEKGKALFAVTATGQNTQLGKISRMIKEEKETKTPLQKKFLKFSRLIGGAVLAAIIVFAVLGVIRGQSLDSIFVTAIALVVSAIPEGLLPAITIILVLGMRRLAKKKALIRKLDANEAMGAVTVICLDKTGTLTRGEMQVSHIVTGKRELLHSSGDLKNIIYSNQFESHARVLEIAALVNDAYIENPNEEFSDWIVRGRPTDKALLLAGIGAGVNKIEIEKEISLVKQISFNSRLKYAVHFYKTKKEEILIYFIGAPEKTVEKSDFIDSDGEILDITSSEGGKLLEKSKELASQGLRVLACGYKIIPFAEYEKIADKKELLNKLHLAGFIALKDPLRKDVKKSIQTARKAGIRPIIITGDHKYTTKSIMAELGMGIKESEILEGKDLDNMTDDELAKKVKEISIFARVLPEHKIRIVRCLQSQNEVVAMVGDGINDAPALKAADVGIALGSGADVAKEVADVVLLDSSFDVIVKAIEQGRLIFENIRRVIIYLIADDFSELFLFFSAIIFGLPLPLYPIQILWINLVEDGFPDLALTAEKDTHGLMDEKPRDPREPILNRAYKKFMLAVFFISGLAALFVFYFSGSVFDNWDKARSMTFVLVAFDSLVFAYIVKSVKYSVFSPRVFSNKILNAAVIFSFAILVSGIYFGPFQNFLKIVPLNLNDWGVILAVSFAELALLEICKSRFLIKEKR